MWAAMSALASPWPMHGGLNPERREELRRQAREQLGPARTRAAEERGAAMSLATATEYAVLLASEPDGRPGTAPRRPETVPRRAEWRRAGRRWCLAAR